MLTGSFHGSFHVLHSVIDASCEAKKYIPRRNLKGINFIRVVVKSKTEDEELPVSCFGASRTPSYFVNSLNIKAKPGRTEFGKF